jgi:hypothetical protein
VTVPGEVRAVADFRGTFIQSTIGTVFLRITRAEDASDPEQITVQITDSDGNPVRDASGALLSEQQPEKISDGFYFFDWEVPIDQAPRQL